MATIRVSTLRAAVTTGPRPPADPPRDPHARPDASTGPADGTNGPVPRGPESGRCRSCPPIRRVTPVPCLERPDRVAALSGPAWCDPATSGTAPTREPRVHHVASRHLFRAVPRTAPPRSCGRKVRGRAGPPRAATPSPANRASVTSSRATAGRAARWPARAAARDGRDARPVPRAPAGGRLPPPSARAPVGSGFSSAGAGP